MLAKPLLEALEQRVLLSTVYSGTAFNLSGTALSYTNAGSQNATVADGDTLAGTSLTTLAIGESSNNIAISNNQVSFGGISLSYSNINFVTATGGGVNTLTITGTGGAESFSVTNNFIIVTGSAFPSGLDISYSGFSSVSINGGGGGDALSVNGTGRRRGLFGLRIERFFWWRHCQLFQCRFFDRQWRRR